MEPFVKLMAKFSSYFIENLTKNLLEYQKCVEKEFRITHRSFHTQNSEWGLFVHAENVREA